jgi:hypothetical protein
MKKKKVGMQQGLLSSLPLQYLLSFRIVAHMNFALSSVFFPCMPGEKTGLDLLRHALAQVAQEPPMQVRV